MYLEGQLPYGPVTSNVGAPPIPTMDDPGPQDIYTVGNDPNPVVISPSVATADGIVQTPDTVTKVPTSGRLDANSARYNQCGDYAADGSLTTIRERRPDDAMCPFPANSSAPTLGGMGLFFAALAGLILLTPSRGRR